VGYKEIYEHWDGQYDRDEMVRLLKEILVAMPNAN
jgi:hypothetical protein